MRNNIRRPDLDCQRKTLKKLISAEKIGRDSVLKFSNSMNRKFDMTVQYRTYSEFEHSLRNDVNVGIEPHRTSRGMVVKMKDSTFSAREHMYVYAFYRNTKELASCTKHTEGYRVSFWIIQHWTEKGHPLTLLLRGRSSSSTVAIDTRIPTERLFNST